MADSTFSGEEPITAASMTGLSSTEELTVLAITYPHTANTSGPAPNIDPVKVEAKNFPYTMQPPFFFGNEDIRSTSGPHFLLYRKSGRNLPVQ